jgi:Glycosyl transferase family 2
MTLLARDEADIVDAQIAYHMHAGVDLVIATDNGSQDGTSEILESYAQAGRLHLIREEADNMQQGEWVTRMARLAATEFGADWVINSDADEFWCSHGAPIKSILAQVPGRFGTVRAVMRNFVPRPGDAKFFADHMNVRLVPGEATIQRFRVHPFHAQDKVLHRAHSDVIVSEGNHDARWTASVNLRGFWPFEVLHFPMRSPAQCVQKWRNYERHAYSGYDVLTDFDAREYYESLVVEDAALARGVEAGSFVVDNRLRDALQTIRIGDAGDHRGTFVAPTGDSDPLYLPPLTTSEAAELAADVAAGSERDAVVKLEEQVRGLENRLAAIELSQARRFRPGAEALRTGGARGLVRRLGERLHR